MAIDKWDQILTSALRPRHSNRQFTFKVADLSDKTSGSAYYYCMSKHVGRLLEWKTDFSKIDRPRISIYSDGVRVNRCRNPACKIN